MDGSTEGSARLPGANGETTPGFLAMASYSPDVVQGLIGFFRDVIAKVELAPKVREAAVLRVSVVRHGVYEWGHHVPSALEAGLELEDIRLVRDAPELLEDPALRAAVLYAGAIDRGEVTDELWANAAAHFDPKQLVELTVIAAAYSMFCGAQNALRANLEPEFQGFAYPPTSP